MLIFFRRLGLTAGIVLSLLCASGAARAQSDIITDVQVVGNQRIEANTVRSYMLLGVGDRFDAARIDRSLKSLYSTQFFRDVSIRREGTTLVVRVVENPVINQLAFEGNVKLTDEDLRAEIRLRPREIYNRARLQADVQRLTQLYQRSGRFAAVIEPKIIQQPSNRVDLVFEINEGEVTGIRRINFVGNRHFSDRKLRTAILSREKIWYRFFATDDTYDPDRLTADRALLREFYLARGYAEFRVVSAVAELSADRKDFFITFTVDEGPQYRFGKVELSTDLPGLDTNVIRPVLEIEPGSVYSAPQIEDGIQALTEAVGRLGYPFVDVQPKIKRNRDSLTIDVNFAVDEGRKVYVERVNITGNVRTRDYVIRREMQLAEGDAFNEARIRRSEQRIKALGFFEKVEIQHHEGTNPDEAIVDVKVEEKPTGELSFGFGFSTVDSVGGQVGIAERNLLGKGQSLSAALGISFRRQSFNISFTEPYFLDRDLAAGFDTWLTRTDFTDFSAFKERSAGIRLRADFPLTELLRLGTSYEIRNDKIQDVEFGASRFIRAQAGQFTTSAVGLVLTLDRRDDRLEPTSGYVARLSETLAGLGGDVHYTRTEVEMDYYHPWADDWILHLGWSEGFIYGLNEQVRLTDRFFKGGNSFAGFAAGGIGPRDARTKDALGGTVYYIGTVEQSFPSGLPDELGVRARVFTEFGTLVDPDEKGFGIRDTGKIRVAIGVGLTWSSPFGPVAIDFSIPLRKDSFDKTEIIRFNFGTRF